MGSSKKIRLRLKKFPKDHEPYSWIANFNLEIGLMYTIQMNHPLGYIQGIGGKIFVTQRIIDACFEPEHAQFDNALEKLLDD